MLMVNVSRKTVIILGGILAIAGLLIVFYGVPYYQSLTTPRIIGDGDSLMASGISLVYLADQASAETSERWYSINVAKGGWRVKEDILRVRRQSPITPNFLRLADEKVWLIAGTNDLAGSDGGEKAVNELLADIVAYFQILHATGFSKDDCFYTDILPRSGIPNPTFERDRQSFNSKIQGELADLAHVVKSGSNPKLQNPGDTEMYTDGTHLTASGYREIANDAFAVVRPFLR